MTRGWKLVDGRHVLDREGVRLATIADQSWRGPQRRWNLESNCHPDTIVRLTFRRLGDAKRVAETLAESQHERRRR